MIDHWKLINEDVHGKEEATKQQKGKAKAAISVRALHKVGEIARPSDSFLFYQNVKKKIRTGNSGEAIRIHCNENETNL